MADFMCNLLVMGHTGSGKSSLLNYLFGTDFKTAPGRPVTGEGLFEEETEINGQKIRVYDSWGLEPGEEKVARWDKLIREQLEEHGSDKPMEEWFHTIIYCVQAGGARVEDIDVEMINKFLSMGYRITVVLTKCDQLKNEEDIASMVDTIKREVVLDKNNVFEDSIEVLPVCSVSKTMMSGEKVTPKGKEEVVELIMKNWRKTVINLMPSHIFSCLDKEIDKWKNEEQERIDSNDKINGYDWAGGSKKILQEIRDRAEPTFEKIVNEVVPELIKNDLESCKKVDMFLSDVTMPDIEIELPQFYDKTNQILNILAEIFTSLAIVPLVVKCILSLSDKQTEREKERIKESIEDIASYMKAQFRSCEGQITDSIKEALGV